MSLRCVTLSNRNSVVDSGQCDVGDDPSVSDAEDETCVNAKAKRSCANGFFYRGQIDGQN